jgi:aryl-alcohol dehydrogenase-like predicted oxidoreductase
MIVRSIPATGEKLPVIGLGTWQTFDVDSSEEARSAPAGVLRAFLEGGGSLVDTSPMYGNAEKVLGALLQETGARDSVFLATKVWTNGQRAGVEQMKTSLARLHTKRVDLMQVHNLLDVERHIDTLREWKAEGIVRYTGITHYTFAAYDDLERLMRAEQPDFVQLNFSLAEPEAEERLLPLAAELGMAVIANRPFASGELFQHLRTRPIPDWAREYGADWATLLLKWVVSHPAVTCAIPATSDPLHLASNLGAGAEPLLDDAARRRLAAAIA